MIWRLYIRRNIFSGTLDLSNYTTLVTLFIDYCDFTSVILDGLTLLTRYLEFTAVGNRIDSGLTSFSCIGCSSLQVINFDGQQLTHLDVIGCNLTRIQLTDTALPADQVNKILVEADVAGNSNGTAIITGGAAAPDATSGGYDGLAAITNLQSKGWTVTTN